MIQQIKRNTQVRQAIKLDVFAYDPNYEENENLWNSIRDEILGEKPQEDGEAEDDDEDEDEVEEEGKFVIKVENNEIEDATEQDKTNLRRTVKKISKLDLFNNKLKCWI